jgi:anaerobic selenocysteine-containing dehydrogenase
MERRDFLKISAISGATAALDACGNPEQQLIRFIPEEEMTPGLAAWKPSICPLCSAGCGVVVRVMEGEAEVTRHGKLGLIKMGLAKKLEGNPLYPVNQGKLCVRGQAALQLTYHPDRVKSPLKRWGERGQGEFREISWDEALTELAARLAGLRAANEAASLTFLARPLRGQRRRLVETFLSVFGAPPPILFTLFDGAVERWANLLSFGRPQLPTPDLARSNYVISFGADFLGTWNSPVAQGVGYGQMRQGRPGLRAKVVQVENRMSQTGANADEWIPCRPGTEGVLALGLAHTLMKEKLLDPAARSPATELIAGWAAGLPDHSPDHVEKRTGVPAKQVVRVARELAAHPPALALVGGAPLAQANGAFNALAVNALNALLGALNSPGGIFFTPPPSSGLAPPASSVTPQGAYGQIVALLDQIRIGTRAPKALLLFDANPVFASPADLHVREALAKIPFIASFGSFIDETSALADLILPDHSFLESWVDDVPESGTTQSVAGLAAPAMRPLHDTRALADVLLDLAHRLGLPPGEGLEWNNYEEMLRSAFRGLGEQKGARPKEEPEEDNWQKFQAQGGWWSSEARSAPPVSVSFGRTPVSYTEPEVDGAEKDFPFYFLPFPSQTFLDGSLAHLPWLQEIPDVLSTAMWCSWVEINPTTAEGLGIQQGDLVEVTSRHGTLQSPALLAPGIAPDTLAMPVGQGHTNFGRYASARGANPLALLAPKSEPQTGSLAWAATRVNIRKVGPGKLPLFAGGLSRFPHEHEQR